MWLLVASEATEMLRLLSLPCDVASSDPPSPPELSPCDSRAYSDGDLLAGLLAL